jgi:hypothetical protein
VLQEWTGGSVAGVLQLLVVAAAGGAAGAAHGVGLHRAVHCLVSEIKTLVSHKMVSAAVGHRDSLVVLECLVPLFDQLIVGFNFWVNHCLMLVVWGFNVLCIAW